MSYESPIDIIKTQMRFQMEGEIMRAVQNVGVNVDKDELLRALKYDRQQYEKGYKDRDDAIIRCGQCEFLKMLPVDHHGHQPYWCDNLKIYSEGPMWFCGDGHRKEE